MANPVRGLPGVDFAALARARIVGPLDSLLDHATGSTLDLSPNRCLDGTAVTWAPRVADEPSGATFTTVVSVFRTALEPDVDAYAARLAGFLDRTEGRLLFAEPTRATGLVARVSSLLATVGARSGDSRIHAGFRLALWRAGLSVIEVRRYEVPGRASPIASVAVGVARHTPERSGLTPRREPGW